MTGFPYQMDASNGNEAFLNLRGALRSDNNKIWNDNLPRIEEIEIWGLLKIFAHVWKENEKQANFPWWKHLENKNKSKGGPILSSS